MKRVLLALACFGAGCTCLPLAGTQSYHCTDDGDCSTGFTCVDTICVGGAGGGDAGEDAGCVALLESCSDHLDNDCDGLADCADGDCDGGVCGLFGFHCVNSACTCNGNGGTAETAETSCSDNRDNDCDGLTDCADPDCAGAACELASLCVGTSCVCDFDAGVTRPPEITCDDHKDNDCNGLTDCQEPACAGQVCGPGGKLCDAGLCLCTVDGGVFETTETLCTDGVDNDCNGLTDCADPACAGATCGATGQFCLGGTCACTGGGAPQASETLCADGKDNDCDGLTDCADSTCAGQACGATGQYCVAGACLCSGNGGNPEVTGESSCTDGFDNDCDGLVDCADPNCNGRSCGTNGLVCRSAQSACVCGGNGGTAQSPETSCSDGRDNDCNTLTDCADPSCDGRTCANNGKTCSASTCICTPDGGVAELTEATCDDGLDNDCNGQIDCRDNGCSGLTCAPFGKKCNTNNNTCQCYLPDGGNGTTNETACGDGLDNDCDGLVDCGDSTCLGLSCGAFSRLCVGTSCLCTPDGGVAEAVELTCNDARDNDCDGLVDCADTASCNGRVCALGRKCVGVSCDCDPASGVTTYPAEICTDGIDNDCNGLVDCADTAACAAGVTCGTNARVCQAGVCFCPAAGAASQPSETTCGDAIDNDCDGKVDCADTSCAGLTCGLNGRACSGTTCQCSGNGAPPESTETSCSDGLDNDCDGLVDCADPNCANKACSAGSAGSVCCGTTCTDISTSATNCGGCGLTCAAGQACQTVTSGAFTSGRCSCISTAQCPVGSTTQQTCNTTASLCSCSGSSTCATGASCQTTPAPGFCHY